MRVARVVLHNVKSYAESTVIDLAPGINAVCGENGAGKSTILEAIGFTLFGYRPYKLDAFLREGEKSGSIVVTVEDDDGCSYQLERKLGSNAGQAVYDETGTRIAEGEVDVRAWRLAFFGMEPGSDLAKLFEDTVGPPQGTLTSVFLEGTADKKDKFDRLLGIKDYPRAAEELRALSNHFRNLAEEAGRRAANLEGRVARLPALEERHGERVSRRSELGSQLDALARRQEALAAARDRLEGALRAVQAAASTLEMAEARSRDAQRRQGELAAELRRAEEAARVVEESRPGAQAYGEAESLLKTLEVRRRERDRLQEEVRSAERNAFQWAQQAKTWEEKLVALAADETRAAELASLAPEQERRERAVTDAQDRVRARRDAEALRPAILQRRSASLERRSEAEAQLARVEAARPEAERLERLRERAALAAGAGRCPGEERLGAETGRDRPGQGEGSAGPAIRRGGIAAGTGGYPASSGDTGLPGFRPAAGMGRRLWGVPGAGGSPPGSPALPEAGGGWPVPLPPRAMQQLAARCLPGRSLRRRHRRGRRLPGEVEDRARPHCPPGWSAAGRPSGIRPSCPTCC